MRVDLFDFDLPEDRIALRPAEPRDAARLLVVRPGQGLEDRIVRELPDLLQPGDVLVLNDTKVIPSRLYGIRVRGESAARVEIMLHKREGADRWLAFARPAKKLQVGERIRFGEEAESTACELVRLDAEVEAKGEGGEVALRFSLTGPYLDEAIARLGELPLPPYIAGKRATDERDRQDYQTVYAREEGAVAAPTAGLHFTDDLFRRLDERGIARRTVTLHVGRRHVPAREGGGYHRAPDARRMGLGVGGNRSRFERGTRTGRTDRGGRHHIAAAARKRRPEDGTIAPFSGDTAIFITPGYRFRAVDLLMTNFHLPRSTLFMLVSAFSGLEAMRAAYDHAITTGYRFYSYGDASLLHRA
jgi:S-adenosylmethionine:tRNA ribosyltransferase-isomerase